MRCWVVEVKDHGGDWRPAWAEPHKNEEQVGEEVDWLNAEDTMGRPFRAREWGPISERGTG